MSLVDSSAKSCLDMYVIGRFYLVDVYIFMTTFMINTPSEIYHKRPLKIPCTLAYNSLSGRPFNLDNSRARAYSACSRCGWGLFEHFFSSSVISLFFLPLSGRRSDID